MRNLTKEEKEYIFSCINGSHLASDILEDLPDDDPLLTLWNEYGEKSIIIVSNFQDELNIKFNELIKNNQI